MKLPNSKILYEVFDFTRFTRLYYPDYPKAKVAYDALAWAELNRVWIPYPKNYQIICNLLNHVGYVLNREQMNVKEQPLAVPLPFFEGACTCRPIPTAAGITLIGGSDDCPVHGFHEEVKDGL